MTKPKFPQKPTLIELKIHSEKSSLPFYIRAEKKDKHFEILVLWAQLAVSNNLKELRELSNKLLEK